MHRYNDTAIRCDTLYPMYHHPSDAPMDARPIVTRASLLYLPGACIGFRFGARAAHAQAAVFSISLSVSHVGQPCG
eukprot:6613366-Prymnesium_polylepis.1